jgi:hypothetical protein
MLGRGPSIGIIEFVTHMLAILALCAALGLALQGLILFN